MHFGVCVPCFKAAAPFGVITAAFKNSCPGTKGLRRKQERSYQSPLEPGLAQPDSEPHSPSTTLLSLSNNANNFNELILLGHTARYANVRTVPTAQADSLIKGPRIQRPRSSAPSSHQTSADTPGITFPPSACMQGGPPPPSQAQAIHPQEKAPGCPWQSSLFLINLGF